MATDIGTMIKRARERKRWTQRQLAAALEVDRKTVDNWENGRTKPARSIGALEEVLGVSLTEDLPPPVPREIAESVLRAPGLSDDDRARVMEAIARTLAGDPQPPPTTEPAAADPTASPAARREQRAGLRSRSCG